jgi:hypothetical protein
VIFLRANAFPPSPVVQIPVDGGGEPALEIMRSRPVQRRFQQHEGTGDIGLHARKPSPSWLKQKRVYETPSTTERSAMTITSLSGRVFNQDPSRAKKAASRGPVFRNASAPLLREQCVYRRDGPVHGMMVVTRDLADFRPAGVQLLNSWDVAQWPIGAEHLSSALIFH